MKLALSLNDCAARLADLRVSAVKSPRFDLFLDLRPGAVPAQSPGRIGACYFPTGGHCHGHPLPEAAMMMIGFVPRHEGSGIMIVYSAS